MFSSVNINRVILLKKRGNAVLFVVRYGPQVNVPWAEPGPCTGGRQQQGVELERRLKIHIHIQINIKYV